MFRTSDIQNELLSLNVHSVPKHESNKLEKIWEGFVTDNLNNLVGIRNVIEKSWNRCVYKGVNPFQKKAPIYVTDEYIQHYLSEQNLVFSSLEPILNSLKSFAIDSGHLLVFCDNKGNILHMNGCSLLRSKAEKMNFVIGSSWSEINAGTNAIGTCISIKKPIQIFSAEHFCQEVHKWTCSASPIVDPATQKILGVIDLTGLREDVHPHSLSVAVSAAKSVEVSLRYNLEIERLKVLEYYLQTISRYPDSNLIALDRGLNVIKASPFLYEEKWITKNNKLVECPLSEPSELIGVSEKEWHIEDIRGRWRFLLQTCFLKGRPIGAIIHVLAPKRINTSNNKTITKYSFSNIIGDSEKIKSIISKAHAAAGCDLPVLIEGESGTGKELFAQAIHASSQRAKEPFISVNCGAIPKELAASEFFGFVGGSFTGADKKGRPGKFEQANNGTIFLDEIGEMPLDLQPLLLRVLEENEVVRLGGQEPYKINVRVIAATNKDLLVSVKEGYFRKDLYYRLKVLSLHIPPLRARPEDIIPLVQHYLRKACQEIGCSTPKLDKHTIKLLQAYQWPGNIRELRNFAYQTAINVTSDIVKVEDLPVEIQNKEALNQPEHKPVKVDTIRNQQKAIIEKVLIETNGNVTKAARRLGINRSTIYRKLGSDLSIFRGS
ncbi:signal-transduction and transcriptional-control protein [Marinithermofilum abyssi]|uniref:Signal-transduction and transcriptional-control protein n=1 Tax=Marinithermofilum abyssi TaxID=1571185 RepID=A0A8J2VKL8_9BACL|nr:sigma-54-dependent Fis family transcriptional regulator [Marinithermofilum abyssi]GGE29624.1 signal-transduction and transcriptional-control protein [Marinithermofilum abyssi]